MKKILQQFFGADALTTILGVVAAVAIEAAALLEALPADAGPGWHFLALALAAGGRALTRKSKKPAPDVAPPATPPTAGFTSVLVAIALAAICVLALSFASSARADDQVQPEPQGIRLCLDAGCDVTVRPGVAFSGAAYDLRSHEIVRSFQVAGLAEIQWAKSPVGLALGLSAQSGETQGFSASQFLTFPGLPAGLDLMAIGAHEMFLGERASFALAAGTILRF